MKEIIYNKDNLTKEEINKYGYKTKAIIVNDNGEMMLARSSDLFFLPGGRGEVGEEITDTLKRELLEETGVQFDTDGMEPFMVIRHRSKDYPEAGINKETSIYYFDIKSNKCVNEEKMQLTDEELDNNFNVFPVKLLEVKQVLNNNISKNPQYEPIKKEIFLVLDEYFKKNNLSNPL